VNVGDSAISRRCDPQGEPEFLSARRKTGGCVELTSTTAVTVFERAVGRNRLAVSGAVLATAVLVLVVVLGQYAHVYPEDFLTYRFGVLGADRGADVYSGVVGGPPMAFGQPFTYTPIATVALYPVTVLGWHATWLLWDLASLAVLALILTRLLPESWRYRPGVVAGVLAAASTTWIVEHNVVEGQINIFLMALCLADASGRDHRLLGRRIPSGVLVGVAAAIKLTPGLFLLHFALTRQWRRLGWATAGAAGATLAGAVVHPALTGAFFRSALWSLQSRVDTFHDLGVPQNSSLNGVLHALGPAAARWSGPIVLMVAAAALLAARCAYRDGRELDAFLVVGLAAPVLSPVSWVHHFVFVLPALTRLVVRRPLTLRRGIGLALLLWFLHLRPTQGATLIGRHEWWTLLPGLAVREGVLLVSVGCVIALVVGARTGRRIRVERGTTLRAVRELHP
jgi:hypothetical protein